MNLWPWKTRPRSQREKISRDWGAGGGGSIQAYRELIEFPISLASCAKQTFQDKTHECYAGHTAIFLWVLPSPKDLSQLNASGRFACQAPAHRIFTHVLQFPRIPECTRCLHTSLPARSVPHCLKCPWSFFAVGAFLLFSKPRPICSISLHPRAHLCPTLRLGISMVLI